MTSETQSRWAATATPGRVRDRIGMFVELVKAQIVAGGLLAIAVWRGTGPNDVRLARPPQGIIRFALWKRAA
jgi:hypothetical protein